MNGVPTRANQTSRLRPHPHPRLLPSRHPLLHASQEPEPQTPRSVRSPQPGPPRRTRSMGTMGGTPPGAAPEGTLRGGLAPTTQEGRGPCCCLTDPGFCLCLCVCASLRACVPASPCICFFARLRTSVSVPVRVLRLLCRLASLCGCCSVEKLSLVRSVCLCLRRCSCLCLCLCLCACLVGNGKVL